MDSPLLTAWRRRLAEPIDGASLAFFRIGFGVLMLVSVVRFWAKGWIETVYLEPVWLVPYPGFEWVTRPPGQGLYFVFGIIGLAALLVAVGLFYRVAITVFFVAFTYVELLEQSTYLNHYYLVSLLALLMMGMPLARTWSIEAWRSKRAQPMPIWCVWMLRFQVGCVYVFAGVAKLNYDWLVRAEPLRGWLAVRGDFPIIGPLLALESTAYAMSWAGAAFDLCVVPLLLTRRARPYAYVAALVFHLATGLLFPIGVFPWVMAVAALVFFDPSWPRRLSHRLTATRPVPHRRPVGRAAPWVLAGYVAVQILLPLRHWAYPGDSAWTAEGSRLAWRVMLIEKTGFVQFRVEAVDGRIWTVDPSAELTLLQVRMLAVEPEMMRQYAHRLRTRYERSRGVRVHVFADSYAAMNGRRSRRLLDPSVDLGRVRWRIGAADWIAPPPPLVAGAGPLP